MNMRPTGTTNSSFTQPTDKRIGDAFPIVEEVYKHLDQLKYLAENSDKLIGKQIEFRANEELQAIQWRYTGQDDWVTLLTYQELVGIDLTQVEETLNQIIDNGVAKLTEDFQPFAREALKTALLVFNDYASASAAAATLPDGQVIDVIDVQERYKVQGSALVFVENFLGSDLADTGGSALVGYDGGTVQDVLDSIKPIMNYPALRAYSGKSQAIYITQPGVAGRFYRDDADTVTADNGGTVIVDASGRRWKRDGVEDSIELVWFGATIGDSVDHSAAWDAALKFCATSGKQLVLPDGLVRVDSPSVLTATVIDWRSIRIRGTFNSSATALAVSPTKVGSVIKTRGNAAIDAWADSAYSENIVIDGVGFIDNTADEPYTSECPIIFRVGGSNAATTFRYTTGNYFRGAAAGYRASLRVVGMTPVSVPSAAMYNFMGPTSFERWNVSRCKSALFLDGASMNHAWVKESTWFYLSGAGVEFAANNTKGNIYLMLENMVMEAMQGFMNVTNSAPFADVQMRNRLTLLNVNRERCGLYGPNGDGVYSGSPLGFVENTDIHILGSWNASLAYGETTLPVRDNGSVIYATCDVFTAVPGAISVTGVTRSPTFVDRLKQRFDLAVSANRSVSIYAPAGYFCGELQIRSESTGNFSTCRAVISGPSTFGGTANIQFIGSKPTGIDIVATGGDGSGGLMATFAITNSSGVATTIDVEAFDPSGRVVLAMV